MDIEKIRQFYSRRIEKNKQLQSHVKKRIHLLGTIRLLIVCLAIILVYSFWSKGAIVIFPVILLSTIFFLWLVVRHNKLFIRKLYLEKSIVSDKNEIDGLDYNFSAFESAKKKIDGAHYFSLDLDVFGDKSIFQSMNRTCTAYGKELLTDWLAYPLVSGPAILNRQEAVKELSGLPDLVHHFRIIGLLSPGKLSDLKEIEKLIEYPVALSKNKLWKILSFAAPVFWIVFIALLSMNIVPLSSLGVAIFLFLIIGESQRKKIDSLQHIFGKKVKIFSVYSELMGIIEQQNHQSSDLNKVKNQFVKENLQASVIFKQLSIYLNDLDVRYNVLARLLLNTVFLWDIRKTIKIELWKEKNAIYLKEWIKALGEYDALCSLGTFAFNHPEYIYPEITGSYFEMKGKGLGHPLMHRDVCVKNDIDIAKMPFFMIVTGANMAGKSTYLRTIGVNYLLSCIGAPVCADSLTVYPAQLVTSLRTSDSLTDNESYFFAELKRLKMIIDDLDNGKEMFIILDEILKGTNSLDKQKGSVALVKQFVRLNTCGIIATHDLLLGELEGQFPDYIRNFRFEADITNDTLTFTYKLQTGVAQNMNAYFLMKKMGITV